MTNNLSNYNVRNLMVNKDKNSEFLDEFHENEKLQNCTIRRVLESGNYYIYTFNLSNDEQREELKRIQDDWI